MDLNVSLNAETGVSFGNVHTLYCAVIATDDVALTCQSSRKMCQLSAKKYRLTYYKHLHQEHVISKLPSRLFQSVSTKLHKAILNECAKNLQLVPRAGKIIIINYAAGTKTLEKRSGAKRGKSCNRY